MPRRSRSAAAAGALVTSAAETGEAVTGAAATGAVVTGPAVTGAAIGAAVVAVGAAATDAEAATGAAATGATEKGDVVEGSADCQYESLHAWCESQVLGTRSIIEDPSDARENWCDEELERQARNASVHSSSSNKRKSDDGSSKTDAILSAGPGRSRHVRAQSAGQPPRRKRYRTCQQFRAARSRWYRHFTGDALEKCGGPAEQQDAFDTVVRSWRAYSDGRRSLSASQWDGRLTPAERRMNNM